MIVFTSEQARCFKSSPPKFSAANLPDLYIVHSRYLEVIIIQSTP